MGVPKMCLFSPFLRDTATDLFTIIFFSWFMFWFLTSLRFLPRLAFVIKMAKTKKKLYKYIDLSKEVVTSSERTKLLRWTTTIPIIKKRKETMCQRKNKPNKTKQIARKLR